MKVLIVGNSVSQKSNTKEKVYPKLLRKKFKGKINVIELIRDGNSVRDFEKGTIDILHAHTPQFMVLQVGHVDCAPRPLKRGERDKLSGVRPKWLRNQIIRLIHNHRPSIIRRRGLIQFTPLPIFKTSVASILANAHSENCYVFILPITRVSTRQEIREPWYNREIKRYNDALRGFSSGCVRFIDQEELLADSIPDEYCLAPEDLHLKDFVHQRIADYLEKGIKGVLAANRRACPASLRWPGDSGKRDARLF